MWLAFAFVAALAVTVPLKFLVSPAKPRIVPIDGPVSAFLSRHGLQPNVEPKIAGSIIHATSGDCRMLIMEMELRGTNLDRIDSAGKAVGRPVVFVFEGAVYREPPVRRTLFRYYWARLNERLGFDVGRPQALAVAATASCPLDTLPWGELAS